MKPISVIAPGLETGVLTASTVFYDGATSFGKYTPKNYYSGYKGPMTIREAIAISANIPHVKALQKIGLDASYNFCRDVGITDVGQEGLALALGGLTHGTTAFNMAAAYSAIANKGVYIEPTFYSKVVDSNGNVYVQCKSIEERSKRVMSEQNAYIEQSILESVVKPGGTAPYCDVNGVSIACKTGTTNNDYDRWLCGFSPYYTAACWYGFEKNSTVVYNGNPAGLIWSAIMNAIHNGLEDRAFEEPEGIVRAVVCKDSGHTATSHCSSTYVEVFKEGTVPSPCEGHRSVRICNETGLLASSSCTDISYVTYPNVIDQEQNAPWSTSYSVGSSPSSYCPGDHEEIVEPSSNIVVTEQTDNSVPATDSQVEDAVLPPEPAAAPEPEPAAPEPEPEPEPAAPEPEPETP